MRWRPWLTTLVAGAMMLTGCARRLPHGVAERYLESLRQFDYPACYKLLSDRDRAERVLPEFLTEIPLAPDVSPVWFRGVLHQTRYELGAERRGADGATATVPLRITAPDLPLWERTLDAAAGGGVASAEAVQRSLDMGDFPQRVYDDTIFLVKEHHHWRIAAGFGERDQIIDRHRQAMNDYLQGRYDQAIVEWRVMIADLRKQAGTGGSGLADQYGRELARIEKLRDENAAARAYGVQLRLSDVAMKMSEERVPAIFGKVRNDGPRAVDALTLAVTWYSGRRKDLKAIHQEEHTVVVTPVQFTDFSRPVVPFLPGESRGFGFVLSAPATTQQSASAYVAIGAIVLTDVAAPLPAARRPLTPTPSRSVTPQVVAPTATASAAAIQPAR
jgi:hypothetical protein